MLTRRQRWLFGAATATGAVVPLSLWVRYRYGGAIAREAAEVAPGRDALVLGCCALADGPSAHLADRLHAALALHVAGRVERIVVSGNGTAAHDEVATMARWLAERGVPDAAILRDPDGVRTLASMRNASQRLGIRRVVVCTHHYHLPRSLYLAAAYGLDAVGLAADRAPLERPVATFVREFGARAQAAIDVRAARAVTARSAA